MSSLKSYQMLIDGQWVDAEDGNTFECINPANGQPWATIPSATAAKPRAESVMSFFFSIATSGSIERLSPMKPSAEAMAKVIRLTPLTSLPICLAA